MNPTLPPGFELVPDSGASPQVPPGFQLVPDPPEAPPGIVDRIKAIITGNAGFDAPEIPAVIEAGGSPVHIRGLMSLARGNPLAMADIASKRIPGAAVDFDPESGAPFVEFAPGSGAAALKTRPGRLFGGGQETERSPIEGRYFLNRPGLSGQDVATFAADAAQVGIGALPTGLAGSLLGRAGLSAVGQGLASLGGDVVAGAAGSEQGLDPERAALMAGLGVAGEFGGAILDKFLSRALTSRRYVRAGKLTPEGRRLLTSTGVDPDDVTPEFIRAFNSAAQRAAAPQQGVIAAEARSLPTPVQLTQGNITRDVAQQSFEDAAAAGARGAGAQNVIRGARAGQQDALRANVEQIGAGLAGGRSLARGEGTAAATQAIQRQAKAANKAARAAYTEARQGNVLAPADTVRAFGTSAEKRLAGPEFGFDLPSMPRVRARLSDLSEGAGEGVRSVKLSALETWRKRVTNDIKSETKINGELTPEGLALTKLRDDYDGYLQGALDNAVMQGSPADIKKWRDARELWARYRQTFSDNKLIDKLRTGDYTQEEALQLLFGAGRLGAKQQTTKALEKIKGIVGENSPEWTGLKAEGFLRLLNTQGRAGFDENLAALFSGGRFATAFDSAMRDAGTLMRTLYTPQELGRLRQFRNVALRVTDKVPGAGNPSGTAHEVGRMIREVMGGGTLTRTILTRLFGHLQDARSTVQAGLAAQGLPASPALFPRGLSGAGAALAGSQSSGSPSQAPRASR